MEQREKEIGAKEENHAYMFLPGISYLLICKVIASACCFAEIGDFYFKFDNALQVKSTGDESKSRRFQSVHICIIFNLAKFTLKECYFQCCRF